MSRPLDIKMANKPRPDEEYVMECRLKVERESVTTNDAPHDKVAVEFEGFATKEVVDEFLQAVAKVVG